MKQTTRIVKEFLNGCTLPYRGNCPVCGGNNTFGASEVDGVTLYRCFRANCDLKGSVKSVFTLDKARAITKSKPKFNSREYAWSNPLQNEACYGYMERFGIVKPYSDGRVSIRYDPRLNRCVFLLKYNGEEYGAVGRSLLGGNGSKWHVYSREKGCPFSILSLSKDMAKKCIIVEDCASACRVSSIASSVALLGTNFNFSFSYLSTYKELYICLDDDATNKALPIQRYLNIKIPTKIVPLKKDLKYLTDKELEIWAKKNVNTGGELNTSGVNGKRKGKEL